MSTNHAVRRRTNLPRSRAVGCRRVVVSGCDSDRRAENLEQAWATALTADYRLDATRWSTSAAGHSLEAAKASRLPNVWVRGGYAVRSDEQSFRITTPLTPQTTFPYIPREGLPVRRKRTTAAVHQRADSAWH